LQPVIRLPSLSALLCFEASARHASFTRAADELRLTQGAVSRQIIGLEARLGTPLFLRQRTRLTLTPAGQSYLNEMWPALVALDRATASVMALKGRGGRLNLSVGSSFANYWLIPRLPDFVRRHPEITLNLATRVGPADFATQTLDASIEYGRGERDRLVAQRVLVLTMRPYAAPAWRRRHRAALGERTSVDQLIQHTTVAEAWAGWFGAAGIEREPGPGAPRYDLMSMAMNAACAGLGAALLPDWMTGDACARGALVRLSDRSWSAQRAYHLLLPPALAHHPPLVAFKSWLLAQSSADGGSAVAT
jgi:LysR family glycine cleavage system transcriptional activator